VYSVTRGRAAAVATLAAALAAPGLARAEGIHFAGHQPLAPHTWITLDTAQKRAVAQAPWTDFEGHRIKSLELTLTPAQRAAVRAAAKTEAAWVTAASRAVYELDCTCGDVNIGVLDGNRVAVLHAFIQPEVVMPSRAARLQRQQLRPALLRRRVRALALAPAYCLELGVNSAHRSTLEIAPGQTPAQALGAAEGASAERLRALGRLLADFPARFAPRLRLPAGWRPALLTLGAKAVSLDQIALASLRAEGLSTFVWHATDVDVQDPVAGRTIAWPTQGAVFASEGGGEVRYLVPLATERESDFVSSWQELVFEGTVLRAVVMLDSPSIIWAAHLDWQATPGGGPLRLASVLFANTTANGEGEPPSAVAYNLVRAADDPTRRDEYGVCRP
jgi:hypothetical protein